MFLSSTSFTLFWAAITLAAAAPTPATNPAVVFLLAGDSTTATQKYPTGGGWGDGFKNFTLNTNATALNFGHNGATTKSFIDGGDWGNVMNLTSYYSKILKARTYVTIQFGHNDQKLANFTQTYHDNLVRMVNDTKVNGGIPIIVSSLTRRGFKQKTGKVDDTLQPWATAALGVANETNSHCIDLWKTSLNYVQAIGMDAAYRLNLAVNDTTHLNVNGSIVFGRMVSDLIRTKYVDEFAGIWNPNATLTLALQNGKAVF